jgi:adenosine deaminase
MRALVPDRIGHGVRAAEDERVLADIVERGVALEVNPGSNIGLGVYGEASEVPLRTLVDAGALVALGADDPLLFGTRLVDQYEMARSAHGFTDQELAALAASSIRASRASSGTKARLLAEVDAWLLSPDPADRLDALRPGGTVTIG